MSSAGRVGAFSIHTPYHESNLGLIDRRYAQAPVAARITTQPFAAPLPSVTRLDAQLMKTAVAPKAPDKVHYIANLDSTGRSIKYPELKFEMSAPNHAEFPALNGLAQAVGNLWKTTVESTVTGPVLAGWRAGAAAVANGLNEPANRYVPYVHSELVDGKYINTPIPSRQTQAAHDLFVGAPRKLLDMAIESGASAPIEVPTQLLSAAATHTLHGLEYNWDRIGVPALQERAMTQFFEHGVLPLSLAAIPAVAVGRHAVTSAQAVHPIATQALYQRQALPIADIKQRYTLLGPRGEIELPSDLGDVALSIMKNGFDPRRAVEVVRFDDGTSLLLDGQVRLSGAQIAGKTDIPADVYPRASVSDLDVAKALVQAAINGRIGNETFRKYMPTLNEADLALLDTYKRQEFLRKQTEAVLYAQTQPKPQASAPVRNWAPANPSEPVQWTKLWRLAQDEKSAAASKAVEVLVSQVGNAKDGVRLVESGALPELFARAVARQQDSDKPVRIVGYTQDGASDAARRLPSTQVHEALRQLNELQATQFPGQKISPTFVQYGPLPENKFYVGEHLPENARILNGLEFARQKVTQATQDNLPENLVHPGLGWGVEGGIKGPLYRVVDDVLVVRMGDAHPVTEELLNDLLRATFDVNAVSLRIESPAAGSKPTFTAYASQPELAARITRENYYDFESGNFQLNHALDVISIPIAREPRWVDYYASQSEGVDRAFNLLTRYASGERQYPGASALGNGPRTTLLDLSRPWPDSQYVSKP